MSPRATPTASARSKANAAAAAAAAAAAEATTSAAATVIEQRLAGIHLRLGSLLLARAELEQLATADQLDVAGLADLAEVRWRTGDVAAAATAAAAHIEAGGAEPIARVVAAEAAAATGRPGEARAHVAAIGTLSAEDLERQFAGMPRRAFWPAAPTVAVEPLEAFGAARAVAPRSPSPGSATGPREPDVRVGVEGPGLWPDDATDIDAGRRTRDPAEPQVVPGDLLITGRADVRAGDPDRLASGLDRLALSLRLDPTLAPGVLEALGRRREPAALVLRGDACRILGRVLEAEAAYLAAAAALDRSAGRGPA